MDKTAVKRYVSRHGRLTPLHGIPEASRIECLDDRRTNKKGEVLVGNLGDNRSAIAFPAGAVGIPAVVMAGMYTNIFLPWKEGNGGVREKYDRAARLLPFEKIIAYAEHFLDGMSVHTDEENQNDHLACAGCGHAMGLCRNPEYGLGELYQNAFQEYAADLKRRAMEGDPKVTFFSYRGRHNVRAVLRLQSVPESGQLICVPPSNGDVSVFIMNEIMGQRILLQFVHALYSEFRHDFNALGISVDELASHSASTFLRHMRTTAAALAEGKPVYDVWHKSGIFTVTDSPMKY